MKRAFLMITAFFYFVIDSYGSKTNFEAILHNMTDCVNPRPPFTDKRMMCFEFRINKIKGKTYLSGRNKVLQEVPFLNYSISTFIITPSRAREQVYRVHELNCRSFMGRAFLLFGNFTFNRTNCRVSKSTTSYKDLDFDKMAHSIPNWHYEGNMIHQVHLVARKKTVFCLEIFMLVRAAK